MSTATIQIYQPALDRGLSIHPLKPRSKEPVLPSWQKLAVNSAEIMSGQPEDANYGVVANHEFCILDIDHPEEFRGELGVKLPLTYTVETQRGHHYYFRHTDASRKLGNRGAGVFDFQADCKYVVGEGSVHPSGHIYACTDESPIIEIPDSLVAVLSRFVQVRKSRLRAKGLKSADRDDVLRQAGLLFRDGVEPSEMMEALLEYNETKCEVKLSVGDLQRMVDYAFSGKWERHTSAPKARFKRDILGKVAVSSRILGRAK